ncbi:MAG: hypothetical protein Kow0074_10320 [Candidatus Zixiibacteriota bacterium]
MTTLIDTLIVIHGTEPFHGANFEFAYRALAEELPPNAAVICVERPVDLISAPIKRPRLFLHGIWSTRIETIHPRLVVVRPRLPIHEILASRSRVAVTGNTRMMRRQLRAVFGNLFPSFSRVITWIHHPQQAWTWDMFPDGGRVYHCYDEYTRTSMGQLRPGVRDREIPVLQRAEITFVTADSLAESRRLHAARLEMFPNGIPDFFLDRVAEITDPIDHIPIPRIGYLGQTYDFLMYDELLSVFERQPSWQLVMIGGKRRISGVQALERLPNVHFVGRRPHHSLPAVLPKLDVALLPVRRNPYTHGSAFLKIYAYMAAGIPIVSTALDGIAPVLNHCHVAGENGDELEARIHEALSVDRNQTRRQLREAVKEYTWTKICRDRIVPVVREIFSF